MNDLIKFPEYRDFTLTVENAEFIGTPSVPQGYVNFEKLTLLVAENNRVMFKDPITKQMVQIATVAVLATRGDLQVKNKISAIILRITFLATAKEYLRERGVKPKYLGFEFSHICSMNDAGDYTLRRFGNFRYVNYPIQHTAPDLP